MVISHVPTCKKQARTCIASVIHAMTTSALETKTCIVTNFIMPPKPRSKALQLTWEFMSLQESIHGSPRRVRFQQWTTDDLFLADDRQTPNDYCLLYSVPAVILTAVLGTSTSIADYRSMLMLYTVFRIWRLMCTTCTSTWAYTGQ